MNVSKVFKNFLFFYMILAFTLILYSKEQKYSSSWTLTPINVDGSADDWSGVNFQFEKKVKVEYAFRNDQENLFIIFIFKDPRYLSTIKETGMTVWFNLEGKKKRHYGINFIKKKVPTEVFIAYLEQKRGPLSDEEKSKIQANPYCFLHNIKVINKKAKSPSASPAQEVRLAIFRSAMQEKEVVYEFSIPLERKSAKAPGVGAELGKVVKVGFEWGGLTARMKAARAARGQISAGRPMSPAVSAQSPIERGTGTGGMPRVSRGPKKYSFWVDVQLARRQ